MDYARLGLAQEKYLHTFAEILHPLVTTGSSVVELQGGKIKQTLVRAIEQAFLKGRNSEFLTYEGIYRPQSNIIDLSDIHWGRSRGAALIPIQNGKQWVVLPISKRLNNFFVFKDFSEALTCAIEARSGDDFGAILIHQEENASPLAVELLYRNPARY